MTVAAPTANGASTTSRPAAPRPVQRPQSALELISSSDRSEAIPASAPESASAAVSVQPPGFSHEQLAALSAPLDRANVRQREQGRSRVGDLEGWQVIAEANRIFGFDGWQRQTIAVRCVAQVRTADRPGPKAGLGSHLHRSRPGHGECRRAPLPDPEGTGAGHGIDTDLGQAHESAIKEAETDAMKRALMTFGNPFGLALYDKQQREVTGASGAPTASGRPAARPVTSPQPNGRPQPAQGATPSASTQHRAASPAGQASSPPAAAPEPAQVPLRADTIQKLHNTLRSLPRPLLNPLTQGFRRRFQVPESAVTIADRITLQCHHDWIETFLVQHSDTTT